MSFGEIDGKLRRPFAESDRRRTLGRLSPTARIGQSLDEMIEDVGAIERVDCFIGAARPARSPHRRIGDFPNRPQNRGEMRKSARSRDRGQHGGVEAIEGTLVRRR
jgi:hypothetical protein